LFVFAKQGTDYKSLVKEAGIANPDQRGKTLKLLVIPSEERNL
jgi:hypothetical protein